jgi:hypothetical protein
MKTKIPAIAATAFVATTLLLALPVSSGFAQIWPFNRDLAPIKGLKLGMPIGEAVANMNERARPIVEGSMGEDPGTLYKTMKIPGEDIGKIRKNLIRAVTMMTMRFYNVPPVDNQDLFIVVSGNAPDTAQDLADVGFGVFKSLLITGFFAWAGPDEKVNLLVIGPTLCNALFDAENISMDEFAQRFKKAYNVPSWEELTEEQGGGRVMLYKSSSGPSVALADDGLGRRTVIVWDSTPAQPIQIRGQGSFD